MENPYQMAGKKIRFYREQLGLTQAALAEKAGVSDNFIGPIERGVKHPTLTTLMRISRALEVNLYELFYPSRNDAEENKNATKELSALVRRKGFKNAKLLISIYRAIRDHADV